MSYPSKDRADGRCVRIKANGDQCGNAPAKGATVCHAHGARAPHIAKKALVKAEVMAWGLNDDLVDPRDTMLKLVSQSARRATHYAELLAADFADKKIAALVGATCDEEGHTTGEYMKGLAQLESQERDRCARFCHLAESSGIAREQVQANERYGAGIVSVLREALTALGHDPDAPEVREIVSVALRAIA